MAENQNELDNLENQFSVMDLHSYDRNLVFDMSSVLSSQESSREPYESGLFRMETALFRNLLVHKELSGKIHERQFFYSMCLVCNLVADNGTFTLKSCSRCQLVKYCSSECQKKDWSAHKDFCKVNAVELGEKNIFASAKEEVVTTFDWTNYCVRKMNNTKFALKRNLKLVEEQILCFPRVCIVCKESDRAKLKDCKDCFCAAYCSKEHKNKDKENHRFVCAFLYRARECYESIVSEGYLSCSLPRDIPEVFQSLQKKLILNKTPINISDSIPLWNGYLMKYDDLGCLMTDVITYPLSIIYALEDVAMKLGKQAQIISEVQELTVHLVGSRCHKEILGIRKWEYFMHQLPALKKLRVLFVGPELWGHGYQNYRHEGKLSGCEYCKKRGREVLYEESQMLYNEYVQTDYYRHPDVIVAFNSGFHSKTGMVNDTWPKSLVEMTKDRSVPLIFTSFNRYEAEKDIHAIKQVSDVEVLLDVSKNPFSSLYAMRTLPVHESYDDIVAFSNGYIAVVRGGKEEKYYSGQGDDEKNR